MGSDRVVATNVYSDFGPALMDKGSRAMVVKKGGGQHVPIGMEVARVFCA